MEPISKEVVFSIWDHHGESTSATAESVNIGEKSVYRYQKAFEVLAEGESAQVIAKRTGWSDKRVREVRLWFDEWWIARRGEKRPEAVPKVSIEHHLENLRELTGQLRLCLLNPHLEEQPYYARLAMQVGGHDWRLDPRYWVALVTPDLGDEELWGPLFPSLKTHLKDSPFWTNLDGLHEKAKNLEGEYKKAAQQLGQSDEEFRQAWEEVQAKSLWSTMPSRTPLEPTLTLDALKPFYGPGFCEKVIKAFERYIPDVHQRHHALEKQLAQLNDDLIEERIDLLLSQGQCDLCEHMR